MMNLLFIGKPSDHDGNGGSRTRVIDQLTCRDKSEVSNKLSKPIVRPESVHRAVVHHNSLRGRWRSANFPPTILRINHYWGSRVLEGIEHRTKEETSTATRRPLLSTAC